MKVFILGANNIAEWCL